MRFPSFSSLLQQSAKTYIRFPFTILNAFIGTIAAVLIINMENKIYSPEILNILLATLLGIPFLTALTLISEKHGFPKKINLGIQIIGVCLLGLYGFALPNDITISPWRHIYQFFMLLAGMHLMVAILPFMKKGEANGFWQYNKSLFVNILITALYSAVLYLGLTIALAALQNLFHVDVPVRRYGQLWVIIAGIFNTWFFLANVPEDFNALEEKTEYPKGLKIFTQYILLPLVGIYFVILYAYAGKIILEWDWPQGWVSILILGFSISGILALLFIHPVKARSENVWIRTLWKWYFFILIPLDIMLLFAIWKRVSEYGITESRYIVIVLALWLCGITLYFIASKIKSIKIIPASLCLLAFLISAGPWSAIDISQRSQMQRLEQILIHHALLVNGKIVKSTSALPFNSEKDISSIVSYICDVHGKQLLQPWFTVALDSVKETKPDKNRDSNGQSRAILNLMGVRYINPWQLSPDSLFIFTAGEPRALDLSGYQHLLSLNTNSLSRSVDTFSVGNQIYFIFADTTTARLNIQSRGVMNDTMTIDFTSLANSLIAKYTTAQQKTHVALSDMTIKAPSAKMIYKVVLSEVRVLRTQDHIRIHQAQGIVFVGHLQNQRSQ